MIKIVLQKIYQTFYLLRSIKEVSVWLHKIIAAINYLNKKEILIFVILLLYDILKLIVNLFPDKLNI